MRQHSSYLMSQIAQDFEFRARLGQWSVHPEAMTRQILTWTDGQPFLTYRLYKLVLDSLQHHSLSPAASPEASPSGVSSSYPPEQPADTLLEEMATGESVHSQAVWVDRLIRAQCIDRCTDPELLKHLRRICKSILEDRRNLQLLEIYQAVLGGDSVPSHHLTSLERRLVQTGLIKVEGARLAVSNRLYPLIFDQTWLERAFKTVRSRKPNPLHRSHPSQPKGLPTLSIHRSTPLGLNHKISSPRSNQISPALPVPSLPPSTAMTASFPTDSSPPGPSPTDLAPRPEQVEPQTLPRSISSLRQNRSAILLGVALVTCTLGALAIALMSYGRDSAEPEPQSMRSELLRSHPSLNLAVTQSDSQTI